MMKQLYMRNVMAAFAALAALSACHNDSYETGQGAYSLMQADFVEAHTSDSGVVNRVETDDGTVLSLSQPHRASWASVADSVYRALLYYEKTNESYGEASYSVVKVVTLSQVTTLHPKPLKQDETMSTDPVKFESMWISANGKYLNIGLYLKSGKAESDTLRHKVGMIHESETASADGKRTVNLRFFHDQGGVPEYYSTRYYVSVPCKEIDADSVVVTINTYNGTVERRFALPKN